jgi:hypothetical protein
VDTLLVLAVTFNTAWVTWSSSRQTVATEAAAVAAPRAPVTRVEPVDDAPRRATDDDQAAAPKTTGAAAVVAATTAQVAPGGDDDRVDDHQHDDVQFGTVDTLTGSDVAALQQDRAEHPGPDRPRRDDGHAHRPRRRDGEERVLTHPQGR